MTGILYKITNSINSKVYIGKTYTGINVRMQRHVADSKKRVGDKFKYDYPLYKAMRKYGHTNFVITEIAKFESGILEQQEIEYIKIYNSYSDGYNCTLGGDGSRKLEYTDNDIKRVFEEEGTISKTAKRLGINRSYVGILLHRMGVDINNVVVHNNRGAKCIINNETLVFNSLWEAANWVIDKGLCKSKIARVVAYRIGVAINNKEKYLEIEWMQHNVVNKKYNRKNKEIEGNGVRFKNYGDAVKYIMDNNLSDAKYKTICGNIWTASNGNTTYLGIKWKLVDKD